MSVKSVNSAEKGAIVLGLEHNDVAKIQRWLRELNLDFSLESVQHLLIPASYDSSSHIQRSFGYCLAYTETKFVDDPPSPSPPDDMDLEEDQDAGMSAVTRLIASLTPSKKTPVKAPTAPETFGKTIRKAASSPTDADVVFGVPDSIGVPCSSNPTVLYDEGLYTNKMAAWKRDEKDRLERVKDHTKQVTTAMNILVKRTTSELRSSVHESLAQRNVPLILEEIVKLYTPGNIEEVRDQLVVDWIQIHRLAGETMQQLTLRIDTLADDLEAHGKIFFKTDPQRIKALKNSLVLDPNFLQVWDMTISNQLRLSLSWREMKDLVITKDGEIASRKAKLADQRAAATPAKTAPSTEKKSSWTPEQKALLAQPEIQALLDKVTKQPEESKTSGPGRRPRAEWQRTAMP